MTLQQAENKFNIELVDRTHLFAEDVEYWLHQECEIIETDKGKEIYCNDGLCGII